MDYFLLPIEISVLGVFMPPLLPATILGALVAVAVVRLLTHYNWIRFVWHPPLFFLAMVTIWTVLIGIFVIPV